jgi:hypothetical protein
LPDRNRRRTRRDTAFSGIILAMKYDLFRATSVPVAGVTGR